MNNKRWTTFNLDKKIYNDLRVYCLENMLRPRLLVEKIIKDFLQAQKEK